MYFKYSSKTDAIKNTRHKIEIGCVNARGKPIPVEPAEKAKKVRGELEKITKGSGGSVQFFEKVDIIGISASSNSSDRNLLSYSRCMITATDYKHD